MIKTDNGMTQMYDRWSGYSQLSPLTPEESLLDKTYEAIDATRKQIGTLPLSLFTAQEYASWLLRVRVFEPSQSQLNDELRELRDLQATLETRRNPIA